MVPGANVRNNDVDEMQILKHSACQISQSDQGIFNGETFQSVESCLGLVSYSPYKPKSNA